MHSVSVPGVLLLPEGHLPLNIFEPRYLAMFDAAIASHRLIGMVQPALQSQDPGADGSALSPIGCIGRITSFSETGDGRYIVSLTGSAAQAYCEVDEGFALRVFKQAPFIADLSGGGWRGRHRSRPISYVSSRNFLESNQLEADWDSVERAGNQVAGQLPFDDVSIWTAEKQALLEAPDLKSRADALIAIMENRSRSGGMDGGTVLQ